MSDATSDLRALLGKYGYSAVHKAFQECINSDYEYLHSILGSNSPIAQASKLSKPSKPSASPTTKAPDPSKQLAPPFAQSESATKAPKNTIVSIKKEGEEKKGRGRPRGSGKKEEVSRLVAESETVSEPDTRTWQLEQEQAKRTELDAQGISTGSLLTRENLQKWISEEQRTFAYVARMYVGCPEHQVKAAAKAFEIVSVLDETKKAFIKS